MQKYIIGNITLLVLCAISIIFCFYCWNYPAEFSINSLNDIDWNRYLLIVILINLLSFIIVFLFFRKNNFIKKYLLCFFLLLIVFFFTLLIICFYGYNEQKNIFKEELTTYTIKAENDIKADLVERDFFCISYFPKNGNRIIVDSISKKFGVKLLTVRDSDLPITEKAKEKYEKITEIYLNKRNGNGWENKMRNAIEPYMQKAF